MARKAIAKTPIGQRLSQVREALEFPSRAAFAAELGMHPETLGGYERGDSNPDIDLLSTYSQRYSVNLNWVLTGEGGMFQSENRQVRSLYAPIERQSGLQDRIAQSLGKVERFSQLPPDSKSLAALKDDLEHLRKALAAEQHGTNNAVDAPLGDFIALPFLDVEASAGHGAVVAIHEEVKSVISFERAFLRSLGAVPDRCKIITARGDSMTPTIPDGALIVVDHSQREAVNGWLSVINVCGDLLVKRVRRRLDGTVELVSDNPIYPVEAIGSDRIDQLIIVGRVVYFCRAP